MSNDISPLVTPSVSAPAASSHLISLMCVGVSGWGGTVGGGQ
jgi:hypothetical protein